MSCGFDQRGRSELRHGTTLFRLVLGSGPLAAALRYLVNVLARDPEHPPLVAGDVITTGTPDPSLTYYAR